MSTIFELFNYWIVVILMMTGLYIMITRHNLIKKLLGLSIFQTGIFYFYISLGKVLGGSAPIIDAQITTYSNPLPHVLILTAIVVGVATTAVGLALIVRIYDNTGSIEEDDIRKIELNLLKEAEASVIATKTTSSKTEPHPQNLLVSSKTVQTSNERRDSKT